MRPNIIRIRHVKPEIRILGIDDGAFKPHTKGLVDVVGVVYRGGYWLDGVMKTEVEIDGTDATEKIASMITQSDHYSQLRVVMLDGVTFAGLNVVDIKELLQRVHLPIIVITRERPLLEKIKRAVHRLPESRKRLDAIASAGKITKIQTHDDNQVVYMQIAGILLEDAEKIVKNTSTRSSIPEALRVAHIIASGLTKSKENV
jgi:endonuclease V-like protein UPF0215 family